MTSSKYHTHVDRFGAGGRACAIVAGHSVQCAEFGNDPSCPGPDHPITIAARAACEALTRALDTERRAADEVEARGGQMTARDALQDDRQSAAVALRRFSALVPSKYEQGIVEMWAAVKYGYAREKWTLRIMAIAAEAAAEESGR